MSAQQSRLAAVTLLAAATVTWAALPLPGGSPGPVLLLIVAAVAAAAGTGRLALGDARVGSAAYDPLPVRLAADAAHALRSVPWPEVLVVAVLLLEAVHPKRAWHTAALGAALLAYLLAAHLADSAAPPGALRPLLPVIAAGLGLAVLAAAAVALPAPHGGTATALRALAVASAVLAAGLALPTRRT